MGASHLRATWALGLLASRTTALLPKRELLDFNWTSVVPSEDLRYHDCYGGYKCARLQVPLDWTTVVEESDSSGHTNNSQRQWVAIAITTLPATVSDSDPSFGGPVLVNPGGPSGSGAEMVLDLGRYLQGVVDSAERHYEILGFDPRGTGWSTPRAECYQDHLNRFADLVQTGGMPPATSPEGLALHFQAAAGGAKLCSGAGNDSIFAHMSTASVARDMLEIVERAETLRRRNSTGNPSASVSPKQAKLQYLGFSYGSYLGNTFASMFPGRVGRLVVDGITDPDDFVRGVSNLPLSHFTIFLTLSSPSHSNEARGHEKKKKTRELT
jgi:pimeloyl-ACP methyl ester carboxylesterase